MKKEGWNLDHIPPQQGRIALVTGASGGIGFHTARALSIKGAKVVMACRNLEKGELARRLICSESIAEEPQVWHLDLARKLWKVSESLCG